MLLSNLLKCNQALNVAESVDQFKSDDTRGYFWFDQEEYEMEGCWCEKYVIMILLED